MKLILFYMRWKMAIAIVSTVILKDDKILMIKEGGKDNFGLWNIPSGGIEQGENIVEAAIREAKEETGLEVENPALIDVVSNVDYDETGKVKYDYVIIDYLVHVKAGTADAASDAAELRWVPFDEVEKYDLTSSFRRFFRQNRKELEKASSF